MTESRDSRRILLSLQEILLRNTDEQHPMTAQQLQAALADEGYSCERKALYRHLEALSDFGLDLVFSNTPPRGYYVASRDFELPELRLLVDAVQSSRFISMKKSEELIGKLGALASRHEARQIRKGLHMQGISKTDNERVYYTLDALYRAIAANRRVTFRYFAYTPERRKEYRNGGEPYLVSPYAIVWDDEKYYLQAYHEKYDDISSFRVDRMEDTAVSDLPRLMTDRYADYDPGRRSKTSFDQFTGKPTTVIADFDNRLAGAVIDRFGDAVEMRAADAAHFTATFPVEVSPWFLSWLFGFGDQVKVRAPRDLVERYRLSLEQVLKLYPESNA